MKWPDEIWATDKEVQFIKKELPYTGAERYIHESKVPVSCGGTMEEPECPWPKDIWPMTDKEYAAAIPDKQLRTAISGFLMRCGWELALAALAKGE